MSSASCGDDDRFTAFFNLLLDAGVYIPPSPYEAWFVSTAHSNADIDRTLEAVETALARTG